MSRKFRIEGKSFGFVFGSTEGTPNVIITVQHNGLNPRAFEGLFTQRKTSSVPDLRIMPIAGGILQRSRGKAVIIFNCIPRTILDTNVEEKEAHVDPSMKDLYQSYHHEVSTMIRSANTEYGRGRCCLLDLHGFVRQPEYTPEETYDVILGTRNLQTVKLSHCPKGWERVDKNLAQYLQEAGLSIFLPEAEPIRQKLWREKVQQENPQVVVIERPVSGYDPDDPRDEETYVMFRESLTPDTKHQEENAVFPPSAPDFYNGGYLIHSHFREGVAAAIQVEISPELREPKSSVSVQGTKKREGFVSAVSKMICSLP